MVASAGSSPASESTAPLALGASTLVYALAPNEPLDEMLKARARAAADAQLKRTHHSMGLENQALDKGDLEAERERLALAILAGDPRRLWDGP